MASPVIILMVQVYPFEMLVQRHYVFFSDVVSCESDVSVGDYAHPPNDVSIISSGGGVGGGYPGEYLTAGSATLSSRLVLK